MPGQHEGGLQGDPLAGSAPNWPVQIVNIDKVAETLTLLNVSAAPISLDGWHMCSIRGNQEPSDRPHARAL